MRFVMDEHQRRYAIIEIDEAEDEKLCFLPDEELKVIEKAFHIIVNTLCEEGNEK